MTQPESNKTIIQNFIQAVWNQQNLNALPDYWNANCINHAMPGEHNAGYEMLHAYHAGFLSAFEGIDVRVEIGQQISERDHVMTYTKTFATHDKPIMGMPPTGKMSRWSPSESTDSRTAKSANTGRLRIWPD